MCLLIGTVRVKVSYIPTIILMLEIFYRCCCTEKEPMSYNYFEP